MPGRGPPVRDRPLSPPAPRPRAPRRDTVAPAASGGRAVVLALRLAAAAPAAAGPCWFEEARMFLSRWLSAWFAPARPITSRPRRRKAPALHLERLEDRTTPSTAGLLDSTFGSGGIALTNFNPASPVDTVAKTIA